MAGMMLAGEQIGLAVGAAGQVQQEHLDVSAGTGGELVAAVTTGKIRILAYIITSDTATGFTFKRGGSGGTAIGSKKYLAANSGGAIVSAPFAAMLADTAINENVYVSADASASFGVDCLYTVIY